MRITESLQERSFEQFRPGCVHNQCEPGVPIRLHKYIAYHTSKTASPEEIGRRADWTLDRVVRQGFPSLLAEQQQYLDEFWARSDLRLSNVKTERTKLSTVEMQQATRL